MCLEETIEFDEATVDLIEARYVWGFPSFDSYIFDVNLLCFSIASRLSVERLLKLPINASHEGIKAEGKIFS